MTKFSKTVLVTGATGFIGANLVRTLLSEGHRVHVFIRLKSNLWRLKEILPKLSIHHVDLLNKNKVSKAVKEIKPQWIFHLATYGAYSYQNEFEEIFKTNVLGAIHLTEGALKQGFESFINVGSSSEYGLKNKPTEESDWLDPNSNYALTKAFATMLCRYRALSQKANFITLRAYSIYGPFEDPNRLIPTLLVKGLEGKFPPLVSKKTVRDFVYVDDFCNACLRAAAAKNLALGSFYNVGSQRQTTIEEAVQLTKKMFNIKRKPVWGSMKNRRWDTNIWISDSRLIKKDLGWQAKTSLVKGLGLMADWLVDNPQYLSFYQKALR